MIRCVVSPEVVYKCSFKHMNHLYKTSSMLHLFQIDDQFILFMSSSDKYYHENVIEFLAVTGLARNHLARVFSF